MSAPEGLEYKNAASPDAMPADAAGALNEGVIEALVAVTGVKDDVGDVIVPGAFRGTLETRKPKVCLGHDWNRPIGKTLDIKELLPGDPALPKTTAEGKPWPKEAGAVWAQFQTNMDIDDGKNAFHSAKFYGPESTYSIGYKATNAKHKGGVRYIHELDLFEFGPVLHPANRLATLQSIKAGEPEGVENADLMASWEAVKSSEPEGMTFQDYSASLASMEAKDIRRVNDANYWGYPKGTPIRPGMKPRGKSARDIRKMGLIPSRTVGTEAATGPADAPTKGKRGKAEDLARRGDAEGLDLGYEIDYDKQGNVLPGRVRARNPKGKDEEHVQGVVDQITDSYYVSPNGYDSDYEPLEGLLDEGITPAELREDLENHDDLKPKRLGDDFEWFEQIDEFVAEYTELYNALAKEQVAERRGGNDQPAPAEKPATTSKPRAAKAPAAKSKPITPGGYAVTRDGYAGSVVAVRDGNVEISKPGEPIRTVPLADVSGGPAEPVKIKLTEPQDQAAGNVFYDAYYPEEEMGGRWTKDGFEVLDLGRAIDSLDNELDIMEENPDRKKSAGAGTRSLRAKLVKMATFDNASEADAAPKRPAGLEEFGAETGPLSSKPTGGRSIEDIVNSLPVNTQTQNVRYRIAHGEDVLDDPTGSGLFAVTDGSGKSTKWTVTVGSGASLPTERLLGEATNDKTAMPNTPKKMTAWLTALGGLRDANGNPPQYGSPDTKTTLGFKDAEGRGLAQSISEVAVPAYLAAIGKDDGFQDRSTPAMWKRDQATAMSRMPREMRDQLATFNLTARQAYYLNRSEGNDHATAMQRVRDMQANARSARESAEAAPVNRTIATDDNGLESTPEGEISTTRLLSLDRVTGPAKVAAMSTGELERHDAELTRRAAALGKAGQTSPAHQAIKNTLSRRRLDAQQEAADRARADQVANETPDQRRARRIAEAPDNAAAAARSGRSSRGTIALREANKELPFDTFSSNAFTILSMPGLDTARADGVTSAELARGIASDSELLARADMADKVADIIDSWGLDLGGESDLPAKLRAWGEGVRSELNSPAQVTEPDPAPSAVKPAVTSVAMEDGRVLTPIETRENERQALGITSGDLTLRVYEESNDFGMPWGYEIVSNTTGNRTRSAATYRSPGSAMVRAEGEFQAAERRSRMNANELEEERRYQEAVERAAAIEDATPDPATARATAQARREAVRRREPVAPLPEPAAAPAREPGAGSFLTAEDRAEMARLRLEGRENEVAKYYADARRRAGVTGERDNETRRRLRASMDNQDESTTTITPDLLDEAVESEAASVGLSETPDGDLEVDEDVAQRQVRVEKLIKDVDSGKVKLADQSTEDLTATRRDLVDELRLQAVVAKRSPRPAAAKPTASVPKTRPGLAGAAEDHAEALRSGDAEAIARTRARLESSIRRSRTDSDVARSLADTVTSPDDNDADQLSDLAKRLRSESRERRNASARKRRTVKRIERDRLRSLLGSVDAELRGRGVQLEQVSPELLPDGDAVQVASSLTPDQQIENDIYATYKEFARWDMDWVRLARIQKRLNIPDADWARVLTTMMKTQIVHLAPESNTKVLTDEDRAAALRMGGEDLHLISIEADYAPPGGNAS